MIKWLLLPEVFIIKPCKYFAYMMDKMWSNSKAFLIYKYVYLSDKIDG